jgi:class 3 adenylate cyclase
VLRAATSGLLIEDLQSDTGTLLNGVRISGDASLPIPSSLTVGRTRLGLLPVAGPDEQATSLYQRSYTSKGSIIIPTTNRLIEKTQAFMVVDLVGSTALLQRKDTDLPKIVTAIGQILEHSLRRDPDAFLKCTGDGFFACSSEADEALDTALRLCERLFHYVQDPLQICIALHWGAGRLVTGGDRTGKDIHGVFALQALRNREAAVAAPLLQPGARSLLLMTEKFWFKMNRDRRMSTDPLGHFTLKGLDAPERVFRWLSHAEPV